MYDSVSSGFLIFFFLCVRACKQLLVFHWIQNIVIQTFDATKKVAQKKMHQKDVKFYA